MDILLSRQAWIDQQVLTFFSEQFDAFFAGAAPLQQQRLLELSRRSGKAQHVLGNRLRALEQQTEETAITLLSGELEKKAGYRIDPRTAQLHTDPPYGRAAIQPGAATTKTLWEVARGGFAFNVAHGTGSGLDFTDNSYLTDHVGAPLPGLDVEDFVKIVRELDLGRQIEQHAITRIHADLQPPLKDHCQAQIEFDLLHGHCLNRLLLDADELTTFNVLISDPQQHWTTYTLKVDGERLPIPLFVHTLIEENGDSVFCYFPHRPGGALRRHPSEQSALDGFLDQVIEGAEAGDIAWLVRQLSLADQQTLATHLQAPSPSLADFTWLARQLYVVFADQRSSSRRLNIQTQQRLQISLVQAVQDAQADRFSRDITRLVTSNATLDRQTLKRGLEHVVSETLEMILLPAPGGLLGAGKLVLVTMLGTLSYQTVSAVLAKQNGDASQLVQALSDIADLLISLRLNGVGARLSQRRIRHLLARSGNPQLDRDLNRLNWPAADAPAPPDDYSTLSDTELTRQMLAPRLPNFTDAQLQRALSVADLPRTALEAIWRLDEPDIDQQDLEILAPSWRLRDALRAERASARVDALLSSLASESTALHDVADLLVALVADQTGIDIAIVDTAGSSLSLYGGATSLGSLLKIEPSALAGDDPLRALLLAIDQQLPELGPGKVGDYSSDRSLENRLSTWRQQLHGHAQAGDAELYEAQLHERDKSSLDASSPAHRFAPRQRADGDESTRQLLHAYPDLNDDAIAAAQARYPQLRQAPLPSPLPTPVRDNLERLEWQAVAQRAIQAVVDRQGRGMTLAAESLFAGLLMLGDTWPAGLGLQVFSGQRNASGHLLKTDAAPRHYGSSNASTFVQVIHDGTRYAGYDPRNDDVLYPAADDHGLIQSILRAMTDEQRSAFDVGLEDGDALHQRLSTQALQLRASLADLLYHGVAHPLSSTRMQDYVADVALSGDPMADGTYALEDKLYILHEGRAYQVKADADVSTPSAPIWRVLKPGDPGALAPSNTYNPSLGGTSKPVRYLGDGEWAGHYELPGAGGSGRKERTITNQVALAVVTRANTISQDFHQRYLRGVSLINGFNSLMQKAAASTDQHDALRSLETVAKGCNSLVKWVNAQLAESAEMRAANPDIQKMIFDKYDFSLQSFRCAILGRLSTHADLFLKIISARQLPDRQRLDAQEYREQCLYYFDNAEKQLGILVRESKVRNEMRRMPGRQHQTMQYTDQNARFTTARVFQGLFDVVIIRLDCLTPPSGEGAAQALEYRQHLRARAREVLTSFLNAGDLPPEVKWLHTKKNILDNLLSLKAALAKLTDDYPDDADAEHHQAITEAMQHFTSFTTSQVKLIQAESSLQQQNAALDADFLPQIIQPQPESPRRVPAQPRPAEDAILEFEAPPALARLIRVTTRNGGVQIAELATPDPDTGAQRAEIKDRRSGEVLATFVQNAQHQWIRQRMATALPDTTLELPTLIERAEQRLASTDAILHKATRDAQSDQSPLDIEDYLTIAAATLDDHARDIRQAAADPRGSAIDALLQRLSETSERLRGEGQQLRVAMIQRQLPTAPRVRYLFDLGLIDVRLDRKRFPAGKKNRDFIDEYSISNKQTGDILWYAHFHYASAGEPFTSAKARHLKTVVQRMHGLSLQIQQQAQGQEVEAIYRAPIDSSTAAAIFMNAP